MKVAQTIAETFKEKGLDLDIAFVKNVDKSSIKNYDCLIVGGPHHSFQRLEGDEPVSRRFARQRVRRQEGSAFETQIQFAMSGNAAKNLAKKLEEFGFSIFKPPLVVYVRGKGYNVYEFKPSELDKAGSGQRKQQGR
jgi:flavorubredoxin